MPTDPYELVKKVQAEEKERQKKNVTFRIEDGLINRLRAYCISNDISMTQFLEQFLKTLPEAADKKGPKK